MFRWEEKKKTFPLSSSKNEQETTYHSTQALQDSERQMSVKHWPVRSEVAVLYLATLPGKEREEMKTSCFYIKKPSYMFC